MSDLERLRERISDIDAELLRLAAERTETARAIGEHKKSLGIPLRDWDVERQVLDNARDQAQTLNFPVATARSLMQLLISASRDEQERLSYSGYSGAAERILIVGGAGKMGRWLEAFFRNQGHHVAIYDVRPNAEREDASAADEFTETLSDATCVFVATPLEATPRVIDQIVEIGFKGVVCDIASLKRHLKPSIERARRAGVAIASMHPMFGPGARALSDQVICICDCGDSDASAKIAGFFSDTAVTLVRLSLDEHDRIISCVLGWSHLSNILFAKVLMANGLSFSDITRVGSTTFHSQMATTTAVMHENPDLYFEIQKLNPFFAEQHDAIMRELSTITDWIDEDDRDAFSEMMRRGREWIDER